MRTPHRRSVREIRLTPEGWIFLVILGFITVGAVLRNVNLLILMAGLMYGPLLINWRIAVNRVRSLAARRSLPHRVYANQLASIQWVCENRSRLTAWNVIIRDEIRRIEADADFHCQTTRRLAKFGGVVSRGYSASADLPAPTQQKSNSCRSDPPNRKPPPTVSGSPHVGSIRLAQLLFRRDFHSVSSSAGFCFPANRRSTSPRHWEPFSQSGSSA